MKVVGLAVGWLCVCLVLPIAAEAQRLIPAHPTAPVAFTFPPVRNYTEVVRVRRVASRIHARRRAYTHRHTYKGMSVSRSFGISDWSYHSLLTGWRPLPYEFGPYSARVVVLR